MPPRLKNQSTTNIEFLQALNKYIPSLVLQQLVSRTQRQSGPQQLPELQRMETAVLFADISGFTVLGEACAKQGVRGNEELAFCINRYMEGMVKNFGKYGGDIIKFVGDALIVMWPEEKGPDKASMTVRKAIQCAIEIQKELNNFQVITGVSPLSVKIGLGFGNCALLYVGGVFNRAEFFTVGPALTYALKSEGQATSGGQIIVSETAFKHVRSLYKAEEIISDKNERFYLIDKLIGEGIKTRAEALAIRSQITNETYNKISTQLRGCVPAAIIPYLQIGSQEFGSETRSLTVMFASLGVELSSAETKEGMDKIQKIVVCVQQQVYRHQGSVNKLVMDDKGSTLICLWGLSPMCHDDDATRAILTAFNIRKELKKLDGTYCNIGISSGEMFSGVVGTSGGRKEFSVLGDVANLAARIMYFPKGNPDPEQRKGKINVCMNTRRLASNQISFLYAGHKEFKGKSVKIPIFEPIEHSIEVQEITKKILSPSIYLKPHMSPCCIERDTGSQKTKTKLIGPVLDSLKSLKNKIVKYFLSPNTMPFLAAIKGELGSGKTIFALTLIDDLLKDEDFVEMTKQKNNTFCSSLNAETQYNFLNIWRPILAQLMTWFCKKDNISRDQAICLILNTDNNLQSNKIFAPLLCDIFQVNLDQVYRVIGGPPQMIAQPIPRAFPFVMRENYIECNQILRLVLQFIKILAGDKYQQRQQDLTPILIILDTCHLMDAPSWQLYSLIRDECTNIGVILLQLCNDMGELVIHPEATQVFNTVWHAKSMDQLLQIELPCLNTQSLNELLVSQASKYQQTFMDEVEKMIDMSAPPIADSKMNPEQCKKWKEHYSTLWQLKDQFKEIKPDIVNVIVKRCEGNPLLSLNFFVSLLQNSFIQLNKSGSIQSTQKFRECVDMNDFLSVPAPRIAIKLNCQMIDKFVHSITTKQQIRPGELELCMKAVVMIKAATVLGDDFDLSALLALNPLRSQETPQSLRMMMKLLEQHNFIEIVDDSKKDNCKYRFNKPFLRESIYQIVLFRDQKQGIHGAAATYLLKNPVQVSNSKFSLPSVQIEVLKKHMLISQDCREEKDLSFQARTGLIVTRIQNTLDMDPKAFVKNEYIFKQGQAVNQKTSKRLVTLDSTYFRWYHNEKELKDGTYLGSVPIQFIFQTVSSKMAWLTRPSFSISTTVWFDKQQQDRGKRDFYFACDDVLQMESWLISIEFLRTKAVYDQYTQKNIPIAFPLSLEQDTHKYEERKDYTGLLYEFGGLLKKNTQVRFGLSQQNLNQSAISHQNKSKLTPSLSTTELAARLKALYGIGIVSFSHHLQQTSNKITVSKQSAQLGSFPEHVQQKLNVQIDLLLKDNIASPYTSQNNNSIQYNEPMTQKRKGSYKRRESSISADQVTAAKEVQQDQNDAKTEVQTRRGRHSLASQQQDFKFPVSNDSDFAREQSSNRNTPPQSVSQIQIAQTLTTQVEQDENRQTFAPNERVFALFNQDERLDHLRSQSPPQHYKPIAVQHERQQILLTDQKSKIQTTESSIKLDEQSMMQSIQQFIVQSIDNGVAKLIQQNQINLSSQKDELSQLIASNFQQLQQSFDSPTKNNLTIDSNKQLKMQLNVSESAGFKSNKFWMKGDELQPISKAQNQVSDNDEPVDPVSPQLPSHRLRSNNSQQYNLSNLLNQSVYRQKDEALDQQSVKTLKRQELHQTKIQNSNWIEHQYAQYEQQIQSQKVIQHKKQSQAVIAVCTQDSTCQQNKQFVVTQGTQIQIIEELPNFKLYRILYNNKEGLFLMKDFTKVTNAISQISPIYPESTHFFKDVSERKLKGTQTFYDEDTQELKQKNLKMLDRLQKKRRRQIQ